MNHTGSSGAMEASLALDLITELFDKWKGRIYVQKLVSEDDSTMRSLLQHKNVHDKGQLPAAIPPPIFLCDPSHRIKVMAKPIFKLVRKCKDPTKCKTIDALRIKKYIGCFV